MQRIAAVTITLTLLQLIVFGGCKTVTRALNNSGTIFIVDIVPDGQETADSVERSVKVSITAYRYPDRRRSETDGRKPSDSGEITGMFSKAEAEEIAGVLNSGYMPWNLEVVEERRF